MNSDEIGQCLGDILDDMVRAKKIIISINIDYDDVRIDRYEKSIANFYESDKCIQDTLMNLTGAIMHIKHEINIE